jgi:hypothetical protein
MKKYKILNWLCVFAIVGFFLQLFALYNLKVSYKSEIDLMRTHIKVSYMSITEKKVQYEHIRLREMDIYRQLKQTRLLIWVFLSLSVICITARVSLVNR